jgi:fibro-slime domain-containing protein
MKRQIGFALFACALVAVFANPVKSDSFIWKVPVTYFDFRSNGSNPEFQADWSREDTMISLIQDTLDANRRPIPNPALVMTPSDSQWLVRRTDLWFRPWSTLDTVDFRIPSRTTIGNCRQDSSRIDTLILDPDTIYQYNYRKCDTIHEPASAYKTDTAFKNIQIDDSLLLGIETEADDTLTSFYADLFFPIDNKGFGAELGAGFNHNYSFTMQMHNRAIYHKAGASLTTSSDDDSWIFINNHLALDNGGAHATRQRTVYLDSLHLKPDSVYSFDLFFAERAVVGSVLRLDMYDMQLVDKTLVVTRAAPYAGRALKAGKSLALGNGISIMVPLTTASVVLQMSDLQGRTLVKQRVVNANAVIGIPQIRSNGIAIVNARCFDAGGHALGVVSTRCIGARF